MDQTTARALTEAGYLPLSDYLRLVEQNGWKPDERLRNLCPFCTAGHATKRNAFGGSDVHVMMSEGLLRVVPCRKQSYEVHSDPGIKKHPYSPTK